MDINLADLREMHPRLTSQHFRGLVGHASLALERNSHKPGVKLALELQGAATYGVLSWPNAKTINIDMHDRNRVTEDGAEAVALAVAHRHHGWQVVRRVQQGNHADWLLEDSRSGRGKKLPWKSAASTKEASRGDSAAS